MLHPVLKFIPTDSNSTANFYYCELSFIRPLVNHASADLCQIGSFIKSILFFTFEVIYLRNTYIYTETKKLIKKYGTRDPFEIMDQMNIVVGETSRYKTLKGYCFMSCKTIYVMINSFLSEEEKMIVAAHELGHIILHRSQLKMAPMQDDTLYNMTDNTEYQANLFAADLLINDEEIEDMVQNEDLDYFGLCSSLNATPELMSFKLYSLTKRGQAYHMPMEIQSNFLAK